MSGKYNPSIFGNDLEYDPDHGSKIYLKDLCLGPRYNRLHFRDDPKYARRGFAVSDRLSSSVTF